MLNRIVASLGRVSILTFLLLSRLSGQSPEGRGTSLFTQKDATPAIAVSILELCPENAAQSTRALMDSQDRLASTPSALGSADGWHRLACLRAMLFASDVPSRDGKSWLRGALEAIKQGRSLESGTHTSGGLLAVLSVAAAGPRVPAGFDYATPHFRNTEQLDLATPAAELFESTKSDGGTAAEHRACVSLLLNLGDFTGARHCALRGLALGVDSSWYLLRLSWLSFLEGDTVTGLPLFHRALDVARTPAEREDAGWHLEPGFLENTGASSARCHVCLPAGILTPYGSAARLTAAQRTEWASLPANQLFSWIVRELSAETFRRSDSSYAASRNATALLSSEFARRLWRGGSALVQHLQRHFHAISYAGGTFRPCLTAATPSGYYSCAPTRVELSHTYLEPVVSKLDLWHPQTGVPIQLLVYAVPLKRAAFNDSAGARTARFEMELRDWSPEQFDQRVTSWVRTVQGSQEHWGEQEMAGLMEMSASPHAAWSFAVSQDAARRGVVGRTDRQPLGDDGLALSDLVLANPDAPIRWMGGTSPVDVTPGNTFERAAQVQVYYQIKSATDIASLNVVVTVAAIDAETREEHPVVQLASDRGASAGLTEVRNTLDFSRLGGKSWYRLTVMVEDPKRHQKSERSRLIFLR